MMDRVKEQKRRAPGLLSPFDLRRSTFVFPLLLLFLLVLPARGQTRTVFFDETTADYWEPSLGEATGGDALRLAGPGADRMPVETGPAASGAAYGVVAYRHRGGGHWQLAVGPPEWVLPEASFDSLAFYVNGPAAVPAAELPALTLVDRDGDASFQVRLSDFLNGLDDDPATWQYVTLPVDRFTVLGRFDPERFREVRFAPPRSGAASNPSVRTLHVDALTLVRNAPPPAPVVTLARSGHRRAVLRWRPADAEPLGGFRVYRSLQPEGGFAPIAETRGNATHYVDEAVDLGATYHYQVRAVSPTGQESAPSATASITPTAGVERDAFLDIVQRLAFDYFWNEANPANGLVRDRSTATSASSIAAVGFGLSALTVGIDHGWITRAQGRDRVLTTLRFFWNAPQGTAADATGYRGFFYHFLNMETGRRAGTTELSTIDTALLLGGVLHAGEYFDGAGPEEGEIRALADSIYERVDWAWAQNHPPAISHGWRPENGFIANDWVGYNEAMLLYVLALGSPTHPVDPDAWTAWTAGYDADWGTQYGYTYLTFPPLFGHQYSHVWIDFRGIRDAYLRAKGLDYFENSRRATLASRAYSIANPAGRADYGPNVWGLTASDGPDGYRARGAPPAQNDDGTVAPTGAGGSYAFTPDESFEALRYLYDVYREGLWGAYGFKDAFNPGRGWYDDVYLGIDQGPILLMIENGETERVWDVFMQNEAVQRGLARAGFVNVTAAEAAPEVPAGPVLAGNFPNPFAAATEIRYVLDRPGRVTLVVYDVLGREVARLVDDTRPAGPQAVVFDATGLAAGLYVYRLHQEGAVRTGKMLLIP